MKCDHKYEKISTPYTEAKVRSEEISRQQGGVYCDYDNTLCHENCSKHQQSDKGDQNDITQL